MLALAKIEDLGDKLAVGRPIAKPAYGVQLKTTGGQYVPIHVSAVLLHRSGLERPPIFNTTTPTTTMQITRMAIGVCIGEGLIMPPVRPCSHHPDAEPEKVFCFGSYRCAVGTFAITALAFA